MLVSLFKEWLVQVLIIKGSNHDNFLLVFLREEVVGGHSAQEDSSEDEEVVEVPMFFGGSGQGLALRSVCTITSALIQAVSFLIKSVLP